MTTIRIPVIKEIISCGATYTEHVGYAEIDPAEILAASGILARVEALERGHYHMITGGEPTGTEIPMSPRRDVEAMAKPAQPDADDAAVDAAREMGRKAQGEADMYERERDELRSQVEAVTRDAAGDRYAADMVRIRRERLGSMIPEAKESNQKADPAAAESASTPDVAGSGPARC